jgi:hypothetical protein
MAIGEYIDKHKVSCLIPFFPVSRMVPPGLTE